MSLFFSTSLKNIFRIKNEEEMGQTISLAETLLWCDKPRKGSIQKQVKLHNTQTIENYFLQVLRKTPCLQSRAFHSIQSKAFIRSNFATISMFSLICCLIMSTSFWVRTVFCSIHQPLTNTFWFWEVIFARIVFNRRASRLWTILYCDVA